MTTTNQPKPCGEIECVDGGYDNRVNAHLCDACSACVVECLPCGLGYIRCDDQSECPSCDDCLVNQIEGTAIPLFPHAMPVGDIVYLDDGHRTDPQVNEARIEFDSMGLHGEYPLSDVQATLAKLNDVGFSAWVAGDPWAIIVTNPALDL